ncbi:hypothetical protein VTK73DRAFT_10258 [Phialemonium thermophilum]|uniref:Uncharacterized protein n=1 Tax=Phialemonium thermophilum TaxID=223376 RepID=A0ABR3VXL7_9PEZI
MPSTTLVFLLGTLPPAAVATCKKYGGHHKDNLCPYDGPDVKCCVVEETCGDCGENGSSICQWTNLPCSLSWLDMLRGETLTQSDASPGFGQVGLQRRKPESRQLS